MRKILRQKRGDVLVMTLLCVILFAVVLSSIINITLGIHYKNTLKNALNRAVIAASNQYTPEDIVESGSVVYMKINTDMAIETFRRVFAANFNLDPDTLAPLPGSVLKEAPEVFFKVYNHDPTQPSIVRPSPGEIPSSITTESPTVIIYRPTVVAVAKIKYTTLAGSKVDVRAFASSQLNLE